MIEQLLYLFEENGISLRITLDAGSKPTAEAVKDRVTIAHAEGDHLADALESLELKVFGKHHFN